MTLKQKVFAAIYAEYPWLEKLPQDWAIREFRRLEKVKYFVAEFHGRYHEDQ